MKAIPMNSTHAAVGVGTASAMDALTTLMTGWHGMDGSHAAAAAWLLTAAVGAAYAAAIAFIRWKWPVPPTVQVAPSIIQS